MIRFARRGAGRRRALAGRHGLVYQNRSLFAHVGPGGGTDTSTMLARFAPRLARTAWTAPRRALPSLAAARTAAPAAPALRTLTTTAPLAKKKKGGEKAAAAEPPEDVEGKLDLDVLNEKMNKTVAWCSDAVQTLVGSLGRVDACTLASLL